MLRMGWWIVSLLMVLPAQAGLLDQLTTNAPDFLPVEQAFPVSTDVAPAGVQAQWHSADGYYLYQHRIYLTQGETRLTPVSLSQPGLEKYDEAFGDIIAHYGELTMYFDTRQLDAGPAVLHYQGCADAGLCYPPQTLTLELPASSGVDEPPAPSSRAEQGSTTSQSWFSDRHPLLVLGIFFLLGLGLTFTPCVLPMIPILTTVVLGQQPVSAARGFLLSSTYVLGMALTYAAAGLAVGLAGAGANVQIWMQSPAVLTLFAVLFGLLSLAMFGAYELQLPAALRNRLNALSQGQQGGHIGGVFIIGVLSALVVSPCVSAPLAGALAYLSTTGDALLGGGALLALGLGMGTPLIIIGTTGAKLLPKAGPWMEKTKHLFGFMLLAVAIWLLGRWLPAAISLGLTGALCMAAGVHFGALKRPETGWAHATRLLMLMLFIYGLIAVVGAVQGHTSFLNPLEPDAERHETPFLYSSDVNAVVQIIKSSDQPVMVDLYADWCISCKVMDAEIFATQTAQTELANLTWVQLDMTDDTDAQQQFLQDHAVFGPPTVLFFEPGNADISVGRIVGERDLEDFLTEARPFAQSAD